ncbi:MAG: NUDIX hydrolase [Desulfovibrio sp.]|jgi:hypothetical protein|nr:NUDIX hydrolase [Desulfovibrio sp.]
MTTTLYPNLNQGRNSIEIVDSRNTPLGIMDYGDVTRQRLIHRTVAVLLRDSIGRFLLSFQAGSGWTFSSIAPVPAGLSCETCAINTLRKRWNLDTRIQPIGLYPPCVENQQSFVAVFEARLPTEMAAELTIELERHLLLDYDELKGLNTHFNDMLMPYMRIALQNGYIRP